MNVLSTTFTSNSVTGAASQGSALYWDDSFITLSGSACQGQCLGVTSYLSVVGGAFTNNSGFAGALTVSTTRSKSLVTVTGGTAFVNNAATNGAGMAVSGYVVLTASNISFTSNAASGNGGALLLRSLSSLYVSATLSALAFTGNGAAFGGAVALTSGTSLSISNSTLNNNAALYGGAVFLLQVAAQPASSAPPILQLSGLSMTGNAAATGALTYSDTIAALAAPQPINCTACTLANNTPAATLAGYQPYRISTPAALNGTSLPVRSGAVLPVLAFTLVDLAGQTVPAWPASLVTLSVPALLTGLSGALVVPYSSGLGGVFSGLTITDRVGANYTLTATVSTQLPPSLNGAAVGAAALVSPCLKSESFNSLTSLCECQAGTFRNSSNGGACEICPPGTYSPSAGAAACVVNAVGFATVTQTTFTSKLTLSGIDPATFGSQQNATLRTALAASLAAAASDVSIISVAAATIPAGRRLSSAASVVGFAVSTSSSDAVAALNASLGSPASFATTLTTQLHNSSDPVLSSLSASGIALAPPSISAVTLASVPCAAGTFLDAASLSCRPCAYGTVTTSTAASFCSACPPGQAWANTSTCVPCPNNAITAPNNPGQCACALGFYDSRFGASLPAPVCSPCPHIGAVCTSGLVAAKEGFWRETTLSDVFYKCREGNCLEEVVVGPLSPQPPPNASAPPVLVGVTGNATMPTNCVEGNKGPLCALCLPGYALQSGVCAPCDPADAFSAWNSGSKAALLVLCILAGIPVVVFGVFQDIVPRLEGMWTTFMVSLKMMWRRFTSCFMACCCFCFPKHDKAAAEATHPHSEATRAALVAAEVENAKPAKLTELQEAQLDAHHGMNIEVVKADVNYHGSDMDGHEEEGVAVVLDMVRFPRCPRAVPRPPLTGVPHQDSEATRAAPVPAEIKKTEPAKLTALQEARLDAHNHGMNAAIASGVGNSAAFSSFGVVEAAANDFGSEMSGLEEMGAEVVLDMMVRSREPRCPPPADW